MKQPTIANKKVTKYILQRFGIHMSKRLGQNFLIDVGIVQGIVDAANVQESDRILEIGPGIGTLTQALAETGADVTCVELDKRLPEVLAHTLEAYDNVRVIQGDILKVNIPEIMGDKPFKVVANLPYYITTPIIMALLRKTFTHNRYRSHGTKRSCRTHGSRSWRENLWCVICGCTILYRASNRFICATCVFYATT